MCRPEDFQLASEIGDSRIQINRWLLIRGNDLAKLLLNQSQDLLSIQSRFRAFSGILAELGPQGCIFSQACDRRRERRRIVSRDSKPAFLHCKSELSSRCGRSNNGRPLARIPVNLEGITKSAISPH